MRSTRRLLAGVILVAAVAMLVACGDDGDETPSDDTAAATTTTEDVTTETTEATESTTDDTIALSPEDEAACRYLFEQTEAPGGYDPTVVFPAMADLATDGGDVEAAANGALAAFQQNGNVDDAVVDLLSACISVVGE